MTSLFFMWGFMTVWNDLLIPRFKEAFTLNYFQAMLVQFAFFGAYAVGSLAYFIISALKGDPINRIGYKNGVIIGLLVSAVGSALFYPASVTVSYPFFLFALFVVGLGFAMLQISANPYVSILGSEATAPSRLNLSQAFNSLGTTLGPIVGGWILFRIVAASGETGPESVKVPYLVFAGIFVFFALVFSMLRLPSFSNPDDLNPGLGALNHPHVILGMLAIFMYVGGEVCVGSSIVSFLGTRSMGATPPEVASRYLGLFWGGLMVGRFMGAIELSALTGARKLGLLVSIPVLAFAVVGMLDMPFGRFPLGLLLAGVLAAFLLSGGKAHRMLAVFATIVVLLLGAVALGSPLVARWAVIGVGLYCSIMWSNIFSLAIDGLGSLKGQASSLLVMAILGGAVLPPLQGLVADRMGVQASFCVPLLAFLYIVYFGLWGHTVGRKT